jgi:hypothetical protein
LLFKNVSWPLLLDDINMQRKDWKKDGNPKIRMMIVADPATRAQNSQEWQAGRHFTQCGRVASKAASVISPQEAPRGRAATKR